jgi:hypothetical protein
MSAAPDPARRDQASPSKNRRGQDGLPMVSKLRVPAGGVLRSFRDQNRAIALWFRRFSTSPRAMLMWLFRMKSRWA